jgi:hypothetical protein
VDHYLFLEKVRKIRGFICGDMVDNNTCLDHTEKPPSRPTDYVIRHILHVSRPNNSNVGSEWRKSTRIIDRISQRSNRQDQSAEESHTYPNEPNSSSTNAHLITAVKIYKIIQLFGDSAVPHRDLSNYVG